MITLNRLLESLPGKQQIGPGDPDISSIAYDSRRVTPGTLFVCIRGDKFDGHDFITEAIKKGACAIVADDPGRNAGIDVPYILVPDVRKSLPILANSFFDYPSRRLKMTGVTGTKGKTTTTHLIEGILRASGMIAGIIGTMGAWVAGEHLPSDRTTPESVDLQEMLSYMISKGASAVAMEVSSHALVKRRTEGCEYDVGIFTNLTHDHLDFHNTLDEYLEAKQILFEKYPRNSNKPFTAVINADDPRSERIKNVTCGKIVTFGINEPSDIHAKNIKAGAEGVSFDVDSPVGEFHIDLSLGGIFNVYNSLASIGAGLAFGIPVKDIKSGLESVKAVSGRFESINCGQDFSVIVDYAHSPDSLENVLRSARELTSERLLVVFGCGGDRDRTKRPLMGRIGSDLADVCIVTSDNPRSENPESIIQEILSGTDACKSEVIAITDRKEAIAHGMSIARPGDIVVIAGKGHETYQIFKDRTIHFDDREVAREILSERR